MIGFPGNCCSLLLNFFSLKSFHFQFRMQFTSVQIKEQTFLLHPLKAVYWVQEKALLLADFHLGKASHFRKNGIAVPQQVTYSNYAKFNRLLKIFALERVIFLGDLFHSDHNDEWEKFGALIRGYDQYDFSLISGNHDIMARREYDKFNITVFDEPYVMGPLLLSHHPMDDVPEAYYNLAGHVHPGIRLRGKARQSVRLPCFYFSDHSGLLPAFGKFTGTAIIRPKKTDKVFAPVSDHEILAF